MADHRPVFSRTGMDRGRVQAQVDDALKGADDGELFLEYRQSEIVRFRRRPAEGGHFRHHPGLRPARRGRRSDRLCPCHRAFRGRDRARGQDGAGGRARLFRQSPRSPCPHQRQALYRSRSARDRAVRTKVKLLEEMNAYARGKDGRVRQVSCLAVRRMAAHRDHARRRRASTRDIRPLVRINVSVVVEQDGRQESGSYRRRRPRRL